ncbi:MAG: DUF5111 domain-containing protein [Bacteroidota bacterium]|nr:DUF5111 domain-containing protein [Bacteroidota bacterium]
MKNIIYKLSVLLLALVLLYSCTDNDLKYTINLPSDSKFVLSSSDSVLVLSKTNASTHTAISFKWDTLTYGISTPVTYTLQMDTMNGTFTAPVEEAIPVNKYSVSYTDSVMNKKMLNLLKRTPDVQSTIQVRLKANLSFGSNAIYSNILKIKVTPYSLPKQVSYLYMPGVVGGNWNDYSVKLCSINNDGNYEGYVEAAAWANFKFTDKADGTGTTYGSTPNSLYSLDNASDKWNIWFDAAGYFLVKANLNNMTWSKTAINSVCVTGDFNNWSLTATPMTYDSANKVWTVTCNISTIGWGIQFILNGDWSFKYGTSSNDPTQLILGGSNVMPTSTGTKTIKLDLNHPEKYTYQIQ